MAEEIESGNSSESHHWWAAVSGMLSLLLVRRFNYNFQRYKDPEHIPEITLQELRQHLDASINLLHKLITVASHQREGIAESRMMIEKQIEFHLYVVKQQIIDQPQEAVSSDTILNLDAIFIKARDHQLSSDNTDYNDLLDVINQLQEIKSNLDT
jgi:hypothetical protein